MRLEAQPWWTATDRAEWDRFVKEFVDVAWDHKRCRACDLETSGYVRSWCAVVWAEWWRIIEWRTARIIASKAEYLSALAYQRRASNP